MRVFLRAITVMAWTAEEAALQIQLKYTAMGGAIVSAHCLDKYSMYWKRAGVSKYRSGEQIHNLKVILFKVFLELHALFSKLRICMS